MTYGRGHKKVLSYFILLVVNIRVMLRNLFGQTATAIKRRRGVTPGPPVLKGNVSPRPTVPSIIPYPEYAVTGRPYQSQSDDASGIMIYSSEDFPKIRESGRLARKMLDYANSLARPGVSTDYIDALVYEEIIKHGAYPSPVNYAGFPKAVCTSVNEVVCHGIPDDRVLEDGDMLSIDVSVYYNGFHGDNCGTVIVGEKRRDVDVKLIEATQLSLDRAISLCRPGECFSSIGRVIQSTAAEYGFNVVHEFSGHGTGKYLHMSPYVLHYNNKNKIPIEKGMVFTIEPILVENGRHIRLWPDRWTAATEDLGRAAQFEHEILIHEHGAEVLTVPI